MVTTTSLPNLEQQKTDLLNELETWSAGHLHYRPTSDQWSAIDVVDHLVRTEVEILALARKGLAKPHRIGITDQARTRLLQGIFRSERKVKVPANATSILPGPNLEMSEVVERWNQCRRDLADLVGSATPDWLNQGIFRHPVAGWMGMPQIIDFFSVHIIHHRYQIARLRS